MTDLEKLDKIIKFADRAHGDQMRKYTTDRYIVHLIRVMRTCSQYTDSLPVLAAAILHDVLEDTSYTNNDLSVFLKNYMSEEEQDLTVKLVTELTDVYISKDFPTLNRFKRKTMELNRLKEISPEAQTIKYADIIDNATEISQSDPNFAERYLYECYDIVSALTKGNPELRTIALGVVTAPKKYN